MKTHLHNNMKKFFVLGMLVIMVMTCPQHTYAQNNVGINNATPDPSAALDAQSGIGISQGILFPKVNLTTLAFPFPGSGPATHLLVTNTSSTFGRGIGIYRNSGTAGTPVWKKLLEDGDAWNITGNNNITASTSAIGVLANNNFIGTTTNVDFPFVTNGFERMRITSGGNVGIGNNNPGEKLVVNGNQQLDGALKGKVRYYIQKNSTTAPAFTTTSTAYLTLSGVTPGATPGDYLVSFSWAGEDNNVFDLINVEYLKNDGTTTTYVSNTTYCSLFDTGNNSTSSTYQQVISIPANTTYSFTIQLNYCSSSYKARLTNGCITAIRIN